MNELVLALSIMCQKFNNIGVFAGDPKKCVAEILKCYAIKGNHIDNNIEAKKLAECIQPEK